MNMLSSLPSQVLGLDISTLPLDPSVNCSSTLASLDLGDPAMGAAIRNARKILGHDVPLIIEGESGSGKELFARAFHADGPQSKGSFVSFNCAAIPDEQLELELFGPHDGVFIDSAFGKSPGKIQQADCGTLFLDEIGEMPFSIQSRMLPFLEDWIDLPLGRTRTMRFKHKIICASKRRLCTEVAAGRFREDLYYRLNGFLLTLPPLRDREDRIELAVRILWTLSQHNEHIQFSPIVLDIFSRHSWPGNIRQMTNVIQTALAMKEVDENEITVQHLPEDFLEQIGILQKDVYSPIKEDVIDCSGRLEELVGVAIRNILLECNGNVSASARRLGISRSTLYRKAKRIA